MLGFELVVCCVEETDHSFVCTVSSLAQARIALAQPVIVVVDKSFHYFFDIANFVG